MNGDRHCARIWRSVPPSHRPPFSPPTITSVPVRVSARRRSRSRRLPPVSMMTSYRCDPSGGVVDAVVENLVGTDGADGIGFRGAAHAGDVSAHGFCHLHRVDPDATGCAEYEDGLARLHAAVVAHGLQRCEGGDRHRCCLRGRQPGRFCGNLRLECACVLRERTDRDPVYLLADCHAGHRTADGLDSAGYVQSAYPVPRSAQPETREAQRIWQSGHEMPCPAVDGRGLDAYQHFVVGDSGAGMWSR